MNDSELKSEIMKIMSADEVVERLEALQNVDRRDFYTDGELDLRKAKRLGKLHQIKGITCDNAGKVIDIELINDFSGFVYLIRAENGLVKIGRARDVGKRFASLSAASPVGLEILCFSYAVNAHELERELHQAFDSKRVRNEWFRLDDSELDKARSMIVAMDE